MKKLIFFIIIFSILFLIGYTLNNRLLNKKTVFLDKNWRESQKPYSNQVICTLKSSATANFEENHIAVEANIDKEPTVITIIDINSDNPAFIGNLGDRAELTKIDYGSQIYLIEKTELGNINV